MKTRNEGNRQENKIKTHRWSKKAWVTKETKSEIIRNQKRREKKREKKHRWFKNGVPSYGKGKQGTPDHNLSLSLYANIPVLKSLCLILPSICAFAPTLEPLLSARKESFAYSLRRKTCVTYPYYFYEYGILIYLYCTYTIVTPLCMRVITSIFFPHRIHSLAPAHATTPQARQ